MAGEGGAGRKTVFVTGAAGGLGASSARHLAERGWRVFAADLDAGAVRAAGTSVEAVALDVTDPASVEAARARVAAVCDGLDGVVNFAGILAVGSVVELDPEVVRRVLDVNVLGTVRVNRALFPLVLARRGRIVNISSETGWQTGMPFNAPYAMSKHAVECYSDSLRRELALLGVAVIKIQPGPFRTPMVAGVDGHFRRAVETSEHFGALLASLAGRVVREQARAHDPALLAAVVERALTERRPRIAYSVRPDPQRVLLSWLPDRLADRLLALALRPPRAGGTLSP